MKKIITTSILAALVCMGTTLMAQNRQDDYLGLPGDNLNLYAVMKLFQNSKTLEEFERNLNNPDSKINNLDLNGDGYVDYIKVFDDIDRDVHNIILQVAVSPRENQDVAVFTVQKFPNGQVQIQLTGDEELYGKNYIVEPIMDNETGETPNPGYTGPDRVVTNVTYVRTTPYEIAAWPLIRFMFLPTYVAWHSSWYWGYYPTYWHPWRPFSWHYYYYGYHYYWNNDYYSHYRRWDYHRYSRWNDFYYIGKRSYSPDVYHRIQAGNFRASYSHPEDRRHGEEMFARTNPEQYKKATALSLQNNSVRRSDPHTNQSNHAEMRNDVTTRRSTTTTVTSKTVTNPSPNSNAMTNRSVSNTPVMNNSNSTVSRRHTESTTTKSFNNDPKINSNNTNVTTGRSSNTVISKPANNPNPPQNVQVNNTTVQHKSTSVTTSSRRNVEKPKTDNGPRKEVNKENVNKEAEHRN